MSDEQRFFAKVDRSIECWMWRGYVTRKGYGQFSVGRRHVIAHRWAYEHFRGEAIPDGWVVDHLCRRPACVNPDHLEAVTFRENVIRGTGPSARAAKATHCPSGHPYDDINTQVQANRYRKCRACNRIRVRRYYANGYYADRVRTYRPRDRREPMRII